QDIATALAVGTVGNDKDRRAIQRTPLDRAQAAFDWVTREVRLFPSRDVRLFEKGPLPVPPEYVVRRGAGPSLERALVFLALLRGFRDEEAGLHGCLLTFREKDEDAARLWGCGVLAEGGTDIFVFDPILGLPLVGKDGKRVATLADLRNDPGLVSRLQFGDT